MKNKVILQKQNWLNQILNFLICLTFHKINLNSKSQLFRGCFLKIGLS